MPLDETPVTIGEWADSVFGPATDHERSVERAKEEFKELEEAVALAKFRQTTDADWAIAKEAADVCIVLMRLLNTLGYSGEIARKMRVNRFRKWRADGTGHGYHIKDEAGV